MEPTPTPEEVPPTEVAPAPPKLSRKERIVRCFKNLANCLFPWRLRRVAPAVTASDYAGEEEKELVETAVALAMKAAVASLLKGTQ